MSLSTASSASRRGMPRRLKSLAAALVLGAGLLAPVAHAALVRDTLVLLVPDGASATSWPVQVWTDSAAEEGIRLKTMTDSQFLALGSAAASQIAGVILPDSAHINASDAVIAAVTQYANLGGKLMLVYDAGALTDTGFYSAGKSRLSALAGVDYVMYDTLLDRMVGFGPVVGTQAQMDALSLPPGKYLPWTTTTAAAATTATTAATTATVSAAATTTAAASTTSGSAVFVKASPADAGGTKAMRAFIEARALKRIDASSRNVRLLQTQAVRDLLGLTALNALTVPTSSTTVAAVTGSTTLSAATGSTSTTSALAIAPKVTLATSWVSLINKLLSSNTLLGTTVNSLLTAAATGTATTTAAASTSLQAISGYAYGPLSYFSYVTQGTYAGTPMLTSPDHGLVAGTRSVGSGKVMFVNMPLGYFKAIGSDSAPLHGFLSSFARDLVKMPTMSQQPKGVGGIVYNWHVDDGDDLTTDVKSILDTTSLLKSGPFSVHFTAGPDTVTLGDGKGMNLDVNTASQTQFARVKALTAGHELAAHGGWNHDLYGLNANETNAATYLPWVQLNVAAVERQYGKATTEYSAPQGNNPTWAVNWLESHGVLGMYFVGDTGAGAVRSWRSGARLTQSMWSFPIAPQGKYATFEEFDDFAVTDATTSAWLQNLQDFVVGHRTSRLFYNHPPGVRSHQSVVSTFITRGNTLKTAGQFNWYTMTQLARFNQRRLGVTWSATSTSGVGSFVATHPTSLADMTWLLPRASYLMPLITSGAGTVKSDSTHWIVTATSGTAIKFSATEL